MNWGRIALSTQTHVIITLKNKTNIRIRDQFKYFDIPAYRKQILKYNQSVTLLKQNKIN